VVVVVLLDYMEWNKFSMSALRLINETSTTGTVSTLNITDVFTADFDIYKIVINDLDVTANPYIYLRFINSSGSVISSGYDVAWLDIKSFQAFTEQKATNYDKIGIGRADGNGSAENIGCVVYVFNPFSSSSYSFTTNQSSAFASANGNSNTKGIGVLKNTASMSGFQCLLNTGSIEQLTVKTYGLRVDNG